MPFLPHLCAPHDVISVKTMPLSRRHTPSYTVSTFGVNQTNGSQDTAIFVSPPPVAVQTHCHNVNLPICFTRYATHGLPGTSSCTTSYIQLGYQ